MRVGFRLLLIFKPEAGNLAAEEMLPVSSATCILRYLYPWLLYTQLLYPPLPLSSAPVSSAPVSLGPVSLAPVQLCILMANANAVLQVLLFAGTYVKYEKELIASG